MNGLSRLSQAVSSLVRCYPSPLAETKPEVSGQELSVGPGSALQAASLGSPVITGHLPGRV